MNSPIRTTGQYAPWVEPRRVDAPDDTSEEGEYPGHACSTVEPEEGCDCPECNGVKITVNTCTHNYNFLRQDTVTFDTEEEMDVMPVERYDIWVCTKCLDYQRVQV